MKNARFAERFNIVMGVPADAEGAGGLAVPAINMRDCVRATLCFIKAVGVAGDDPTVTITQGDGINAGALTNAKALTNGVTVVDTKRHATAIPATWTAEAQSAASTWVSLTNAEEKGVVLIDIVPGMLDRANDFYAVRAAIADTGAAGAELGVLFWIIEPNYTPPLGNEANAAN